MANKEKHLKHYQNIKRQIHLHVMYLNEEIQMHRITIHMHAHKMQMIFLHLVHFICL